MQLISVIPPGTAGFPRYYPVSDITLFYASETTGWFLRIEGLAGGTKNIPYTNQAEAFAAVEDLARKLGVVAEYDENAT